MYCLLWWLGKISCSAMTAPLLTEIIIIGKANIEPESIEQCHFCIYWKILSDHSRFSELPCPSDGVLNVVSDCVSAWQRSAKEKAVLHGLTIVAFVVLWISQWTAVLLLLHTSKTVSTHHHIWRSHRRR